MSVWQKEHKYRKHVRTVIMSRRTAPEIKQSFRFETHVFRSYHYNSESDYLKSKICQFKNLGVKSRSRSLIKEAIVVSQFDVYNKLIKCEGVLRQIGPRHNSNAFYRKQRTVLIQELVEAQILEFERNN